jgi:hypothetical protein
MESDIFLTHLKMKQTLETRQPRISDPGLKWHDTRGKMTVPPCGLSRFTRQGVQAVSGTLVMM